MAPDRRPRERIIEARTMHKAATTSSKRHIARLAQSFVIALVLSAATPAFAQTGGREKHDPTSIFFWLGMLVLASLLVIVVAFVVRKRMLRDDDGSEGVFLLSDLRRLHREGQLSDEEFARAKAAIVAKTQAQFSDSDEDANDGSGSRSIADTLDENDNGQSEP